MTVIMLDWHGERTGTAWLVVRQHLAVRCRLACRLAHARGLSVIPWSGRTADKKRCRTRLRFDASGSFAPESIRKLTPIIRLLLSHSLPSDRITSSTPPLRVL